MENQEKNLANLFRQMSDKGIEKLKMPDIKLKDAVFSTVDATALVADILDLFTVKFLKTQADVINALPESEYSVFDEKEKLHRYFEKKRAENTPSTEGG